MKKSLIKESPKTGKSIIKFFGILKSDKEFDKLKATLNKEWRKFK